MRLFNPRYLYYKVHGVMPPIKRGALRKQKPWRNWRYILWVRKLPSCISGMTPCEAAHTGTDGGMSQKASDFTCVPLTPEEHREYHQIGRKAMEEKHAISFEEISTRLYGVWKEYSGRVK